MRIQGLIAAPHTPFDSEGVLWLDAIERQAEFISTQPVVGVFIAGSTGESASLSVAERMQLCERWTDLCRGSSLQVIVHVGSNCLPESTDLAAHAAEQGADAIAANSPCYFQPQCVDDLIAFLAPVAGAASEVPFYFYDIPVLTGVELSMIEFLEKSRRRIPSLNGLKYTNSNLSQLNECVSQFQSEFDILFGCDEMLLAGLINGIQGAVGSTYNFAAPLYDKLIQHFRDGDIESARRQQAHSVRLVETLARHGFLSSAKAAMAMIGVDCGPVRPPLCDLTDQQRHWLHTELQKFGLLSGVISEASAD